MSLEPARRSAYADMTEKTDSKLIPVEIFGETYKVRGDEDRGYIADLARYVDAKMKSITEASRTGDSLKVAILAALNIADEYFKLQRKHEDSRIRVAEQANELTEVLDEVLGEDRSEVVS
jgi:cell division protein ZapA